MCQGSEGLDDFGQVISLLRVASVYPSRKNEIRASEVAL